MEQNKYINTETRKIKLEIEIPFVYHEALLNNPMMDKTAIMEKAEKAASDAIAKAYNNPRVLPDAVKKYLEAKYGVPPVDVSVKKRAAAKKQPANENADSTQAEDLQEETAPADNNPGNAYDGL